MWGLGLEAQAGAVEWEQQARAAGVAAGASGGWGRCFGLCVQQTQEGACRLHTWPGGVQVARQGALGKPGLPATPHIPSSPVCDKRPVEEHGLGVGPPGVGVGSAVCSWELGPEPCAAVPPVTPPQGAQGCGTGARAAPP